MNTCVSRRSFTLRNRARTHPAAAYRNPAPLPMLLRAAPHAVRSLMFRRQYCLRSSRAWQRGKQGVVPFAPWAVRLQRLRFLPACSRAKVAQLHPNQQGLASRAAFRAARISDTPLQPASGRLASRPKPLPPLCRTLQLASLTSVPVAATAPESIREEFSPIVRAGKPSGPNFRNLVAKFTYIPDESKGS
jgi:hypothetical protein